MTITGLSSNEVKERFAQGLFNQDSKTKTKTFREILVENILSVFNIIIALIIVFFITFYIRSLDSRLLLDAIGVFLVAFVNTVIAIYQELKAKRLLDRATLLLKKQVTVVRDSKPDVIPINNIVIDDVIYLQRGDQAVVDGRVLLANHLEIDESLLTGESIPIMKDSQDNIFSGSFCLSGNGYYRVEKVGSDSYAAKITKLAKKYKFSLTPLQKRINLFIKVLFIAAVALVILKIFHTRKGNPFDIDSIREMGTILESLVPQGLVLMSSVSFALGAFRISKLGAVVQKLNAIESFSNVSVTCMDKTGTLTENKLSVFKVIPLSVSESEDDIKRHLGTYAWLSSEKNATIRALEIFEPDVKNKVLDEIPFNSAYKMSFLKVKKEEVSSTFLLGGYDILADNIPVAIRVKANKEFQDQGLEVYRNLLFLRVIDQVPLDEIKDNLSYLSHYNLEPVCIISLADKVRQDVFEVIELFERQGIKIKILSGDAPTAIQAVCRTIGWKVQTDDIISGEELAKRVGDDYAQTVRTKMVFGRLKPEQKLGIIKELRAQKNHTAMIGDGVNDLPAIKEADLGIAMEEGSAVTKEVSDIVLLQNRFSLLPQIFDEGNKVINTVGAMAKLFLTKNFLIVLLGLFSILFSLEFPLTPRRVSLMNIFIIGLPSMIIALSNKNDEPYKNFMLDLFTFVGLSALVIIVSGYIGFYLSQSNIFIKHGESETVMIAIMTIVSVANFFAVVIHKGEERKLLYLIYGIIILGCYVTIINIHEHKGFIKAIKIFYEIVNLHRHSWQIIAFISIGGSLFLFVVQKIRSLLVNREWIRAHPLKR